MDSRPSEPDPDGRPLPSDDPAVMLSSLQSIHQLADGKAGILAGAQGALAAVFVGGAGTARQTWAHGAAAGAVLTALACLFYLAMVTGAACVALTLRPRLWRPESANRYSVRTMASGVRIDGDHTERSEMRSASGFLANVAVTKCRYVDAALAATLVMALVTVALFGLRTMAG